MARALAAAVGAEFPEPQARKATIDYVGRRKRIDEAAMAREVAHAAPPPNEPAPVPITRVHAPAQPAGPRVRGLC